MRFYSNPKHSDEYLKKLEWENYLVQLKKDDKEIGQFLKRAAVAIIIMFILALAWSVLGN